ncbi:MAG TPA: hypothetical protein VMF06_18930, partial [Candidatus Limnocylindria bacterium]|nr:hypothetical protein [Candidatus Limnocylindria bacterium]
MTALNGLILAYLYLVGLAGMIGAWVGIRGIFQEKANRFSNLALGLGGVAIATGVATGLTIRFTITPNGDHPVLWPALAMLLFGSAIGVVFSTVLGIIAIIRYYARQNYTRRGLVVGWISATAGPALF